MSSCERVNHGDFEEESSTAEKVEKDARNSSRQVHPSLHWSPGCLFLNYVNLREKTHSFTQTHKDPKSNLQKHPCHACPRVNCIHSKQPPRYKCWPLLEVVQANLAAPVFWKQLHPSGLKMCCTPELLQHSSWAESKPICEGWHRKYMELQKTCTMLEPKVLGLRMSSGHPHNSAPRSAKHQYNADDTAEDRQMACATNQRARALRRKSFHTLTGPLCQVWVPKSTRRIWVILQRGGCSNIRVGHIRQRRLYMDLFSWQVQTSWLKAKAPLSESSSWVVADFWRRSWTLSWKVWESPRALHGLVKSTSKS